MRCAQTVTAPISARAAGMPAPVRWLSMCRQGFRRYAEERRAIAQLRGMTDSQLRDLGITRADILRMVCGKDNSQEAAR